MACQEQNLLKKLNYKEGDIMKRLTERFDVITAIDKNGNETHSKGIQIKDKQITLAYEKLFQLEDVEEELGIELVTLFKALKQKWAYCIYDGKICPMLVCIEYYKDSGFAISSVFGHTYKIKDYGKTWALTKEELEK